MKVMITWQLHEGKLHDILGAFAAMTAEEEQALMGGMKLIGRWHDVVRGSGAAVYEADSAADVSAYALQWNEHMDLDISVVLDDEETKALGKNVSS
jgi:hypothetical protein